MFCVLRCIGQRVEHLVDEVPVPEGGAVAVAGADLFPGMRERRLRRMRAAFVQFGDEAQHRSPFGFAKRGYGLFQLFEHSLQNSQVVLSQVVG